MNWHGVEVVRHVLWTTVTGGWLYDPRHRPLVNVVQLYLWLLLLLYPLLLTVCGWAGSRLAWLIYVLVVLVLFAFLKFANHSLHRLFDRSEKGAALPQAEHVLSESTHGVEMVELAVPRNATRTGSSRRSSVSDAAMVMGRIDHRVDVHRSSVAEGVDECPSQCVAPVLHTITDSGGTPCNEDRVPVSAVAVEVSRPSTNAALDLPCFFGAANSRVHRAVAACTFRRTLSVSDTVRTSYDPEDAAAPVTALSMRRMSIPLAVETGCRQPVCSSVSAAQQTGPVGGLRELDHSQLLLPAADDDVSAINVWPKRDGSGSHSSSVYTLTGGQVSSCSLQPCSRSPSMSTTSVASVSSHPATCDTPPVGSATATRCRRRAAIRRRATRTHVPDHVVLSLPPPPPPPDALSAATGESGSVVAGATPPVASGSEEAVSSRASGRWRSHLANSYDDTTRGAVHHFQDEMGNWLCYTFQVPATAAADTVSVNEPSNRAPALSSCCSDGSSPLPQLAPTLATRQAGSGCAERASRLSALGEVEVERQSVPEEAAPSGHCSVPSCVPVSWRLDRLWLLSLLDRVGSGGECVLAVAMAVLCSGLAAAVLHISLFCDLSLLLFSLSLASSQFCLLKSVQPDSSSPTHGHNRVVAFSRAFYFCLLCSVALLCSVVLSGSQTASSTLSVYGLSVSLSAAAAVTQHVACSLLVLLPLLFVLGVLPQPDTFVHYLLEQCDRHLAGGTACTSLRAAVYAVCRSVVTVLVLYGFAYAGLAKNGAQAATAQHIVYSVFCGVTVATCYHLSRCASEPLQLGRLLRSWLTPALDFPCTGGPGSAADHSMHLQSEPTEQSGERQGVTETAAPPPPVPDGVSVASARAGGDPLPELVLASISTRLQSDALACCGIGVFSFAVHCSTVFTALRPTVQRALWLLAIGLGFVLHYIVPQLRRQLPWLFVARPLLPSAEYRQFEVSAPARLMWFERVYVLLVYVERHILFPLVFLAALTTEPPLLVAKLGLPWAALAVVLCAVKCLRVTYTDPSSAYVVLSFVVLLFHYDFVRVSETFLVDYFVVLLLHDKLSDLLLKLQFVATYIAPWQIAWGSAFHLVAQPLSVPHSALLLVQTVIAAALSSPLNPFLGSAFFIMSYMRPVRFWERDYNTCRADHSNTRMAFHLDSASPGANDNNLNSIFYEQLSRSLQRSLCGDVLLGRWGEVRQGDVFVLASDYLNCLVHIVELANGLVTFQVRGLEFRGTYCQRREVEAILEDVDEDVGCCCCELGHLPHLLSANQIFNQRWLAWQVVASKYVLEGYSITDNAAASMLQVFEFRKVLVAYYVKSVIFYAIRSPSLLKWLQPGAIMNHLTEHMGSPSFADVNPVFSLRVDDDYDFRASGITRASFCGVYLDWIRHCVQQQQRAPAGRLTGVPCKRSSPVVLLCLALSLLARRMLYVASHHSYASVDFFLYGLHALFKGDFRVTCLHDEWVFCDMDLMHRVIAPAVRMSVKLLQDHFLSPDDYQQPCTLYEAIEHHDRHIVMAHEGDPVWRTAVLSGAASLLSLRHVVDDGSDHYKIIMLNRRHLGFRLIQLNRECVRGLWSSQQQELIFLRNRDRERGSIQNAKQALRNIINSSCDQPIGYPIYVSPLLTSYAETSGELRRVLGAPVSWRRVGRLLLGAWHRLCARCGQGCGSGASLHRCDDRLVSCRLSSCAAVGGVVRAAATFPSAALTAACSRKPGSASLPPIHSTTRPVSHPLAASNAAAVRCSLTTTTPSAAASSPAPPVPPSRPALAVGSVVRVVCGDLVYDTMNGGRPCDVLWPCESWRVHGGKDDWGHWLPDGRTGTVVHYWSPGHPEPLHRSHLNKLIVLVEIDCRYVPVAEAGCELVCEEACATDSLTSSSESPPTDSAAVRPNEYHESTSLTDT